MVDFNSGCRLELLGHSLTKSLQTQQPQTACFAIQFEGLTAQLFHSNYSTELQMELQRLLIRDQSHIPTLFESHIEPRMSFLLSNSCPPDSFSGGYIWAACFPYPFAPALLFAQIPIFFCFLLIFLV